MPLDSPVGCDRFESGWNNLSGKNLKVLLETNNSEVYKKIRQATDFALFIHACNFS